MVVHATPMLPVSITVVHLDVKIVFHCGADVLVMAFIHENVVQCLIVNLVLGLVNCRKVAMNGVYMIIPVYLNTVILEQIHVNTNRSLDGNIIF
jgi:hypothetical protein